MDHRNPFAPIAFEPDSFGKGPTLFRLPVPTTHLHPAKTLRMGLAQLGRNSVDPLPPLFPPNMARTLYLTDPVFALALNQPRQLKREHTIIKGIVGLRKAAFFF